MNSRKITSTSSTKDTHPMFSCPYCPKIFRRTWSVRRHVESIHEKAPQFFCLGGCQSGFFRSDGRMKHWEDNIPCRESHFLAWVTMSYAETRRFRGQPKGPRSFEWVRSAVETATAMAIRSVFDVDGKVDQRRQEAPKCAGTTSEVDCTISRYISLAREREM